MKPRQRRDRGRADRRPAQLRGGGGVDDRHVRGGTAAGRRAERGRACPSPSPGGGAGVGRMTSTILPVGAPGSPWPTFGRRIDQVAGGHRRGQLGRGDRRRRLDAGGVQQVIDRAVQAYGRLDVMINAAASSTSSRSWRSSRGIRSVDGVNVAGTFYGTQLAARQMIAQSPNCRPGEVARANHQLHQPQCRGE